MGIYIHIYIYIYIAAHVCLHLFSLRAYDTRNLHLQILALYEAQFSNHTFDDGACG